jgi:F0F1-type ATP synthase assembly protein I
MIIVIALFIGIALDAHFGVRGVFTIGLLLLSIPFSLFVMVRIALGAVGRISPPRRDDTRQETKEESR